MADLGKAILLCAVLVASTVAVPVSQRGQCARYCTDGNDFTLTPGTTYTYDYETTAVTTVQGTSHDKTQLQMTAHADVEVLSKCELSLRMRNVILKLSDPESPDYLVSLRGVKEFARTLEGSILRFSYQNGQVEHVCPSEQVPDWVLNIQKGVLSAFQTYMVKPDWTTRTVETDILGKCTAEYHSLGKSWQGMHTIRKLKDLSTCSDREDVQTFMQGTPYAQDFQTKSLPVLKGSQECEQVVGSGFLQSSSCSEKLVFRPFSGRGNGVVTAVTQKLTFADTSNRKFTGNDYRPTTQPLLYKHAKQQIPGSDGAEEDAEGALFEVCEASKVDISIAVPRKFSLLVYRLKDLSLKSLKALYHKTEKICPGNSKARKFLMDAIPLVSTADSARFMLDMITRKAVSDAESNFWLTSLSFIRDPSPEMILTFTPLLDGRYDQAILGISSLIRNYCAEKDCSNVPEVQTAVHKLFENVGENCFSHDEKKVILSLKAIANIGQLFGKRRTLEACYKNPQIRTETRLAAVESFRRVSCEVSRDDLLNTYINYDEETEIRIAAYLAVMRCPSASMVEAVKNTMMGEKINHVGSFVWTHLNALSRTQHPERQPIRDILSNLYLLNKFGSDARKLSSASELSYFLDAIDSGVHVDSHLVFSTDSYLPRTAMFNLTLDVFGKTCNLFQIDGRMEGMEHVVESFFGPNGYFPQKNVAKLLREKRSVDDSKLERISKQFNEHRSQPDPYGSVDVKVFGTSMWYGQLRQDGAPDLNLLDIVTKLAQEKDSEFSRSFMFLDTTFTVPMASGLPLKVALNGTASVGLKIGGKFDVKTFDQVDVLGHIEPSGAIEISSLLTVEAGNVARSGMRVISTLHSSSVLDGKLEVRDGELVKAQLNMPRDRIDIFNVQSKVYLLHGTEERQKKTRRKESTHLQSCTGQAVSKVLGVKLCSELELPPYRTNSPLHPLNGAAKFNVFLEKTDPTLKSYNFNAQWKSEMTNGAFVKTGMLALNTPDSQVDRDVKLELLLSQADHSATLKLKTPFKKFGATAKLMNEDAQKKLDVGLTVDDKDYFSVQSELKTTTVGDEVTHTPSLEVRVGSKRVTHVTGSAVVRPRHKYAGQLQVEDLTEKPILAKVNVEMGKRDRYDVELSLSSFALEGTVKGYAQLGDSVASKVTAEYRFMESKLDRITVVAKVRNLSANSLAKYTGLLNVQATVLPEWNTELSFESMATTGHVESTVSVSLGDGVRSRVHTIKMQEIVRYEGGLLNNKVDASLSFVYPEKNLDYALSVNHENTDSSLKNKMQLQYDENKKINSDVELKVKAEGLISVAGDMKLDYPGRKTGLVLELIQTAEKEYRGAVTCQWRVGQKATAVVHYKDKCEGSRVKYEVDGNLHLPGYEPMTFSTLAGYHRGQYAGFSELDVGSDKYRAKADLTAGSGLNHRMSGQLVVKDRMYGLDAAVANAKGKLSCNAELKMPNQHRTTAKFEGRMTESLATGSFETYWDADRDASKRFSVSAELRDQNSGYEGKIIMLVLRRTIRGTVTTSLSGNPLKSPNWKTNNKIELQWSPAETVSAALFVDSAMSRSRQQVNGHLEFATPYSGYENLTLNVNHLVVNQQWDSEVSTVLPMGKTVVLSSAGKYSFARGFLVDLTKRIQTSYKGYEEMYVKLTHDHNARELTNKAELRWAPRKIVQYLVSGHRQPSAVSATLQFNSPFRHFEDISGAINHDYTGGNYKTKGEAKWSRSKMVTFEFGGNHELSGRRRVCTVSLEGTSPFKGYENTGMKVVYSSDGTTVNTEAEAVWNRNKIASSLSVSLRNQFFNRNMEGKFQLTTPFRNYENVQVSSSLEANENSYKVNVDAQLPHRSTASLNSQGTFLGLNDVEVNVVVMSHFPRISQPQRASVDFAHKLQNSKLRSTFDASCNSQRVTILVIGLAESSFNTRNVELSATVNTPVSGYEEVKVELTHNMRGSEYFSKLVANKNKASGSIIHKLNARDSLNFETTLEATSTSTSAAKVSIVQAGNARQLDHNSHVHWGKNQKVQLSVQLMDKSNQKEATIKITTPYRKFREVELKASTECRDWDHKGDFSVVWDRRNKMTLGAHFKSLSRAWESLSAEMEFTSPFAGHELYSSSVKYDLTAPQKEAEVSFMWDAQRRQAVAAKYSFLYSHRLTNLDVSVTTPFADFERVAFTTKYDNRDSEKMAEALYVRGWRKVHLSGKVTSRRTGADVNLDFKSHYENFKHLTASANYEEVRNGLKGEIATQIGKDAKYAAAGEYSLTATAAKGSVTITTPIRSYERTSMEFSGIYQKPKMASKLMVEWSGNKRVELDGDFYMTRGNGYFNVDFRSPFSSYRSVVVNSKYSSASGIYETELRTSINQEKNYMLLAKSKMGGEHLIQLQLNLDSPHSPMKNVQLLMNVDSNPELYQLISSLKWEEKKADLMLAFNRKIGRFYEAKMQLNTPFESFKSMKLESSVSNDNFKLVNAKIIMTTPFEALRKLDVYGEFRNSDSASEVTLKVNYPVTLNVEGKLSNRGFHPLLATLEVEAPFTSHQRFSSKAELNVADSTNFDAKVETSSSKYQHSLSVVCKRDDKNLLVKVEPTSTHLSFKTAALLVNADYADRSRVRADASVEAAGEVHSINGQYRVSGKAIQAEILLESPLLPEQKAGADLKLGNRRHEKSVELSFSVPSARHQLAAKYEDKENHLASLRVESSLLPFARLDSQAKYENNNGRDIVASFVVTTPETVHAVTGSVKNYEQEKFAQLKLECPMSAHTSPFTFTGTFLRQGSNAFDASLSASTPEKEIRIAGNMKNTDMKDIEAFFTINTPFESLKMVRLDGRFRNENFENVDCTLQLETSNRNFPSLSMTSKLSRTAGSEEVSLMLRMPLRNLRQIQILGNAHYSADYSSADSRITLSLPSNKYVLYGQYGLGESRVSGRTEVEIDSAKWGLSGRLERTLTKKDVFVTLSTPSSATYNVGGVYGSSGNKRDVAVTYSGPSSGRYNLNSSVSYDDLANFEVDLNVETPHYGYRNLQGSIHQKYGSRHVSTNIEYSKDNGKKGYLRLHHNLQRDGLRGSFQMGCPYHDLKDIKMAYSRVKQWTKIEDTVELHYNRAKQVKMEVIFLDLSSHLVLEVPSLPLVLSADTKRVVNGRSVNLKSSYQSRTMSFRTSYLSDGDQLTHDASVCWDEKREKRVSYDFKLANTDVGKELWSRLDTPLRSLMLKGNFTRTSRARSAGVDFYWDASRSLERHVAAGFFHTDLSSDRKTSHRLQMILEHPKLTKQIVQTNFFSYSTSELVARSELQYSRDQEQNVLLELRADDMSRPGRDNHYKAEVSLRHPVSLVDVRATAEVIDSRLETHAQLKVDSLDRKRAQNVRELKAKIMKLRQEIEIMTRLNEDQTTYYGQMSSRGGDVEATAERRTNDVRDVSATIRMNRRAKSFEATVQDSDNAGIAVSAAYPKNSVSLKVSHTHLGNAVTDAEMYLGLEQSRIIRSRINWRPIRSRDLKVNMSGLKTYLRNSRASFDAWRQDVSEEMSTRTALVSRSVSEALRPLAEDMRAAAMGVQRDVDTAARELSAMYRRNEFYMRDIAEEVEEIKQLARDVANGLELGCEVLYNITVEQVEEVYYYIYYSCLDLVEYLQGLHLQVTERAQKVLRRAKLAAVEAILKVEKAVMKRMSEMKDYAIAKMNVWLKPYEGYIVQGYYQVVYAAEVTRDWINGFGQSVSDGITKNSYYIALSNYVASVVETFGAIQSFELAQSAQSLMESLYDQQVVDAFVNHPAVDYMSQFANTAMRRSVEIYHNLGLDVLVASATDSATKYVKTMVLKSLQDIVSDFYKAKAGAKYEFQPERGLVSMEFNLPAPRDSLADVLDFTSYPEYERMKTLHNVAAEYYEDFCIWDFYYKIVKYFSPNYWLPAFNAHAILAGNQHYITFDQLAYDFAGSCSYLLARDFSDGNFTAVVNYDSDHRRRSLTVLSDGRKVDIGSDYKVTLDGAKVEAPFQSGDTVVIREGANIRVENERKGFSLVCNFVRNFCSVSMSGFYFGKTGGLFGTFDYEPKLDMMTPDRYVKDDVESFARSWEVGQAVCRSSENFAALPGNDHRVQKKCRALFEKNTSEFRACFKQVVPEAYLRMCVSDLSARHERDHNAVLCESAAAYFAECRKEGVSLKMPKHCVRCERQDGSWMGEGESMQFPRDAAVTAADVVFLVEEKRCNKDKVRYLSKLAQGIEDNFRQKGHRDVRYSVVGFGGDLIHSAPHIHTVDGLQSGPLRSLDSALDSLEYGDGPNNVLEALRFAAALDFRPGTTKSFVLVKCSTCKPEEDRAEYSEVLRALLDGDISLHLLMEQKYEMKVAGKKDSKARRVIGVDKKYAYTLRDVKDSRLSGDGDLLAQLRIPKDVCIPLAFEAGGSSFDSQFLADVRKNTNKKFVDVLARLVVRSSSDGAAYGMCCECIATEDGMGKSVCQKCVSREVASMVSAEKFARSVNAPRTRVRKHNN